MKLTQLQRYLRVLFGSLFIVYLAAGGPWWSILGVYLVGTGSYGTCPLMGLVSNDKKSNH